MHPLSNKTNWKSKSSKMLDQYVRGNAKELPNNYQPIFKKRLRSFNASRFPRSMLTNFRNAGQLKCSMLPKKCVSRKRSGWVRSVVQQQRFENTSTVIKGHKTGHPKRKCCGRNTYNLSALRSPGMSKVSQMLRSTRPQEDMIPRRD